MSGSGKDNGRGNNRRRHSRRRNNAGDEGSESFRGNGSPGVNNSLRTFQKPLEKKGNGKRPESSGENRRAFGSQGAAYPEDSQNRRNYSKNPENNRGEKTPHPDRPRWIPPKINTEPLPAPDCHYCGKPIQEISQAIADKDTGAPVHFDCVVNRIAGGETLEKDESITYIGGGRFGIVSFSGKTEFIIKKIIEWENKDKKAEWRSEICERYSIV